MEFGSSGGQTAFSIVQMDLQNKQNEFGNIIRHEARLVTNGIKQQDSIDYWETFAPVVKYVTIWLVLSIAISNDWELRQLDVSNAFLHGLLEDTVFMHQPMGFHNETKLDHVY